MKASSHTKKLWGQRLRAVLLGLLIPVMTWPATYQTQAPVVVFGDVHGAYTAMRELLQGIGIIDANEQWIAGDTHLVSIGDLLDRGPDSKLAMDMLMRLQGEARAAGGQVHVLIGNHELMNLGGDVRDVSAAEFEALGGVEGHRAAFAVDGKYGQWLRTLPVALKINDTLFGHAGFSRTSQAPIEVLNNRFWQAFAHVASLGEQAKAAGLAAADHTVLGLPEIDGDIPDALEAWHAATLAEPLGETGLAWYRGNTSCHGLIESSVVDGVLEFHQAVRIVVGHTPTPSRRIESRLGDRVLAIDTGMFNPVYKGSAFALRIDPAGALSVLTPQGDEIAVLSEEVRQSQREEKFAESFQRLPMKTRAAQKATAAYLLSDYLEFDLVPMTALDEDGVRQLEERLLLERTRQERQLYRPNYCDQASDYDLLAAFDSLLGKTDRNLDNLAYSRRDWTIRALENGNAFPTSSRLPTYAHTPKLAPALRDKLGALDEATLAELFGSLLKPREVRAVLKRRDKILRWESSG